MYTENNPSPYANADYCNKEYCKIRDLMVNKNTTDEQWKNIERVVALMLFYCPDEIKDSINALSLEITMRGTFRV